MSTISNDYIRREDAICLIKHYLDNPPKNHSQLFISGMEDAYYRMLSNLNNFHSADVVQVVRCKYCKHWQCGMIGMGCYWDADYPHEENDFCSHGERKE